MEVLSFLLHPPDTIKGITRDSVSLNIKERKMKHVQFIRKGEDPFKHDIGDIVQYEDNVADMLVAEKWAKPATPKAEGVKLLRCIKTFRSPLALFNPGDIFGEASTVADKLVAQGFCRFHDAGEGTGIPAKPFEGGYHARDEWHETVENYARYRKSIGLPVTAAEADGAKTAARPRI
jgi:hypothetical protein